jgi:nitrite reductase (NADH) small subunit
MTFLAKVCEIPTGDRKLVTVNGVPVAVFHVGPKFYALNNSCPHRQGPLVRGTIIQSEDGQCAVRCPMHGWKFDLATGDSHGRPANATVYRVTVDGDELHIDL